MKPRRRTQSGQELVEYAIAFPIFMLLVMSIVDLGRATYYYSALHNSAREGARYGIIDPGDPTGIETVVLAMAVGMDPADMTVTTDFPSDDTIRVTVTYQYTAVTPIVGTLLGSNVITIGSRATMQIEG